MIKRKHTNKVKTYSKEELTKLANKVNSDSYKYGCFRKIVWESIYAKARDGYYNVVLNVTEYSDDFIEKIINELTSYGLICNVYPTKTNDQYSIMFSDGIQSKSYVELNPNPTKNLDICWNYQRAYLKNKRF